MFNSQPVIYVAYILWEGETQKDTYDIYLMPQ
jgi:hypothetical protein